MAVQSGEKVTMPADERVCLVKYGIKNNRVNRNTNPLVN